MLVSVPLVHCFCCPTGESSAADLRYVLEACRDRSGRLRASLLGAPDRRCSEANEEEERKGRIGCYLSPKYNAKRAVTLLTVPHSCQYLRVAASSAWNA